MKNIETFYRLPHIEGEVIGRPLCTFAFIGGMLNVFDDEWHREWHPVSSIRCIDYRKILLDYRRQAKDKKIVREFKEIRS